MVVNPQGTTPLPCWIWGAQWRRSQCGLKETWQGECVETRTGGSEPSAGPLLLPSHPLLQGPHRRVGAHGSVGLGFLHPGQNAASFQVRDPVLSILGTSGAWWQGFPTTRISSALPGGLGAEAGALPSPWRELCLPPCSGFSTLLLFSLFFSQAGICFLGGGVWQKPWLSSLPPGAAWSPRPQQQPRSTRDFPVKASSAVSSGQSLRQGFRTCALFLGGSQREPEKGEGDRWGRGGRQASKGVASGKAQPWPGPRRQVLEPEPEPTVIPRWERAASCLT